MKDWVTGLTLNLSHSIIYLIFLLISFFFIFFYSIGGVVLTCLSGKIVCANTLENRLGLAFQESLPDIREGLFPDLEKREIKKKEVEKEKPKH